MCLNCSSCGENPGKEIVVVQVKVEQNIILVLIRKKKATLKSVTLFLLLVYFKFQE